MELLRGRRHLDEERDEIVFPERKPSFSRTQRVLWSGCPV